MNTLIVISFVMTIVMFSVAFAMQFRKIARWQGGVINATAMGIAAGIYGISQGVGSIGLVVMVVLAVILIGGMTFIFYRPLKR